jgi:hypothetical protein
MDHSCSSSGQPAGPERPPAPGPVRTAVKLMYAGAAGQHRAVVAAAAEGADLLMLARGGDRARLGPRQPRTGHGSSGKMKNLAACYR